jgi:hypothetical protein
MNDLIRAWNLIFSIKCPEQEPSSRQPSSEHKQNTQKILLLIPLISLVVGALTLYLPALLLHAAIDTHTIAAVIATLIIAVIYVILCGGKRIAPLAKALEDSVDLLPQKQHDRTDDNPFLQHAHILIPQTLIILALVLLFLLVLQPAKLGWLLLPLPLSGVCYAQWQCSHIYANTRTPQEHEGRTTRLYLWLIAVMVVATVSAIVGNFTAALLMLLVTWILTGTGYNGFSRMGLPAGKAILATAAIIDLAALFIGIIS